MILICSAFPLNQSAPLAIYANRVIRRNMWWEGRGQTDSIGQFLKCNNCVCEEGESTGESLLSDSGMEQDYFYVC